MQHHKSSHTTQIIPHNTTLTFIATRRTRVAVDAQSGRANGRDQFELAAVPDVGNVLLDEVPRFGAPVDLDGLMMVMTVCGGCTSIAGRRRGAAAGTRRGRRNADGGRCCFGSFGAGFGWWCFAFVEPAGSIIIIISGSIVCFLFLRW